MRKNLRVLYSDGEPLPPWGELEQAELLRVVDNALCTSDHVLVISLERDAHDARTVRTYRMKRGARTSIYELVGAAQAAVHSMLEEG
jgi:hypothetical protein